MFNNFPTLHFYIKKQKTKKTKSSPVVAFKRKGPLLYHLIHIFLSATKLGILTWECMRRGSRWSTLWVATGSFWLFWLHWFTACMCVSSQKRRAEQGTKAAIWSWWAWLGISWLCVAYLSHSLSFSVCDLTFLSCVHISDCNWNQGVAACGTSSDSE